MTNKYASRQIRPPIYSMKQTKLRRRRVIRFAILYFVLLAVFLAILVAPGVAGKNIDIAKMLPMLRDEGLLQPTGQHNNDTWGRTKTASGVKASSTAKSTKSADRRMLY